MRILVLLIVLTVGFGSAFAAPQPFASVWGDILS
jgi:hypothetical protein